MRSHNFARSVLRCAARNSGASPLSIAARHAPLHSPTRHTVIESSLRTDVALSFNSALRTFSSSCVSLKKKSKKNAFAAAEDDSFEQEDLQDEDDDLFGGISDMSTSASTTSSSSATMSRVEFAKALQDYRAELEWDSIDKGRFPSLHRWRFLADHANDKAELEELLDLAKLYRDRVGSLGVESGSRFATRASSKRVPEVALNAFLDRYIHGLEYDLESLMAVQDGLVRKLGRRNREEILNSAEIEGSPVQATDLLGVQTATETETSEGAEEGQGKAETIAKHHELDMPLARAQLSIIDRMCLLVSLSSNLSATSQPDPLLLSYVTRAYIQTFHLAQRRKNLATNPLLKNIFTRTDALVSLLTASAQRSISSHASQNVTQAQRSVVLRRNLSTTLSYVAIRGQARFKDGKGKTLDPVRTLYRLMESVDRQQSSALVRKVEPLLQSYKAP